MENPNLTYLVEQLPDLRIAALQGGARSGKSWAVLQYLIDIADSYPAGLIFSIVRESFPAVRATILRDFIEIMQLAGLYDEANESKPSGYYEYSHKGNLFEFFSVDNAQKVKGRKRDFLYINEANEITFEKFTQLAIRTTGKIIIDYNPNDAESYIYDDVLTRPDCGTIITTYLDNLDNLPPEVVAEIERLQDADAEYWSVYGLGQRGRLSGAILGHYQLIAREAMPIGRPKIYGLDFGFSAPSALVEITLYENSIYARELIYQRKLTNTELIRVCKVLLLLSATIYADAAEPDRIKEFADAGFTGIMAASKAIKPGLDMLRSKPLYISDDSPNLLSEVKQYRYKKNKTTGEALEEPLPTPDHAIDALRYAVFSHFRQPARPHSRATILAPSKGLLY